MFVVSWDRILIECRHRYFLLSLSLALLFFFFRLCIPFPSFFFFSFLFFLSVLFIHGNRLQHALWLWSLMCEVMCSPFFFFSSPSWWNYRTRVLKCHFNFLNLNHTCGISAVLYLTLMCRYGNGVKQRRKLRLNFLSKLSQWWWSSSIWRKFGFSLFSRRILFDRCL